ncbi:hypothetical protein JKY72_04795 [Candidatus Gracilibacteria bacterium]|nr:hypothetical protein [Candidatus Gracilibacteria bacterium]
MADPNNAGVPQPGAEVPAESFKIETVAAVTPEAPVPAVPVVEATPTPAPVVETPAPAPVVEATPTPTPVVETPTADVPSVSTAPTVESATVAAAAPIADAPSSDEPVVDAVVSVKAPWFDAKKKKIAMIAGVVVVVLVAGFFFTSGGLFQGRTANLDDAKREQCEDIGRQFKEGREVDQGRVDFCQKNFADRWDAVVADPVRSRGVASGEEEAEIVEGDVEIIEEKAVVENLTSDITGAFNTATFQVSHDPYMVLKPGIMYFDESESKFMGDFTVYLPDLTKKNSQAQYTVAYALELCDGENCVDVQADKSAIIFKNPPGESYKKKNVKVNQTDLAGPVSALGAVHGDELEFRARITDANGSSIYSTNRLKFLFLNPNGQILLGDGEALFEDNLQLKNNYSSGSGGYEGVNYVNFDNDVKTSLSLKVTLPMYFQRKNILKMVMWRRWRLIYVVMLIIVFWLMRMNIGFLVRRSHFRVIIPINIGLNMGLFRMLILLDGLFRHGMSLEMICILKRLLRVQMVLKGLQHNFH